MLKFEDQNVEFKQEYTTEIRKEVIAFANADGGTVYVGIQKDGTVVGVDNPDDVMLKIAGSLKDAIAPDIMPFVSISTIDIDKKNVVQVSIAAGTNRPYYIREKGLKPSGVYVRKGSSSQPTTDAGIREMIIQSSGSSYESARSLQQQLTFEVTAKELQHRNIAFGPAQMRTLRLIGEDGLFTNLAYILSDQFTTTTKVAVFQGSDKAIFRDRKEFSGSILQQLEDVYRFVDICNKTRATFSGLNRTDTRDYPEEALREALLNSMIHRDYSVGASNLINIYDDRIELVSVGGLVAGLELRSIFLGISQTRNPNLAAIFYRMRLIESYGTGISKIERAYRDMAKAPEFDTAKGVFRVTLPNCYEVSSETAVPKPPKSLLLSQEKQQLLDYAVGHEGITRKEAEVILSAGTTKAFRLLKELCESGDLMVTGNGRLRKYISTKNFPSILFP